MKTIPNTPPIRREIPLSMAISEGFHGSRCLSLCPPSPTTHREKSRQRHPAAHVPVSAARRATASPRAARAAGTLPGGRSGGDAKYVPINYLKMWVGCIYFVIHVFTSRQVEYYARVLFSTLGYVKMVCCLMRIDQVLVGFL